MPEEDHVAETNHKKPVYERVGDRLFTFTAGSFFQNNNSILPSLAQYVKDAIFPSDAPEASKEPTHLVDAYCGSGFFGISLSDSFQKVAGVELDSQAVEAAKQNAKINGLVDKSTWLCGDAEKIFAGLPAAGFGGSHSCVIIDVSLISRKIRAHQIAPAQRLRCAVPETTIRLQAHHDRLRLMQCSHAGKGHWVVHAQDKVPWGQLQAGEHSRF